MVKLMKLSSIVLAIWLGGYFVAFPLFEWYESSRAPFGASPDEHYISIKGLKPEDTTVKAYGTFHGGGENCKSFSWSAVDGKKRKGGKAVLRFAHNFAQNEKQYELRIPYKNFLSNGCDMKLYRIVVDAKNAYDTVGFAELRITPPILEFEKAIDITSMIEAKNCRDKYYPDWERWAGGFACDYYINGARKAESEFSYQDINIDFSQFTDDTVIRYDITAGDNYRTEPQEQKEIND
jgi:hypothetical protein